MWSGMSATSAYDEGPVNGNLSSAYAHVNAAGKLKHRRDPAVVEPQEKPRGTGDAGKEPELLRTRQSEGRDRR